MASIVKRKNRYSVVYTYNDDDGNQHQKWETFDTNADAKKRKTQIEFEQQSGTFIIPNATTVADLLEEYCSVYGVNNWAMSTYRSKKGLMYNYIIPLIGDVKLDELTPRLIRAELRKYLIKGNAHRNRQTEFKLHRFTNFICHLFRRTEKAFCPANIQPTLVHTIRFNLVCISLINASRKL